MKKPITPANFTLINADAAKLIRDDLPTVLGEVVRFLEAALPFLRAAEKRTESIRSRNEETSLSAKARHQKIREVKQKLGRRATRKEIQQILSNRGHRVSIKQISRALNPKK